MLFAQATVGLAECDLDGRLLRVNDYFCSMLGRSRDELIGCHLREIVHPDDLPRSEALLAGMLANNSYEVEKRYLRPDGTVVWTRTAASLVHDGEPSPVRAVAVCVDITEDRYREEALRRSEERFRLLARTLPGFVWMTDREGNVTYVNERWSEYTGRDKSEALGAGWGETIHPDDIPATLRIWRQVLLAGTSYETEFRYRRHDGAYRWHVVRAMPHRDPATREVTAWFGVSIDIHDHKLTEFALQEGEQRLKATYEHAAIGISEVDADGRFLNANEWMCAMSGYSRAELLGRRYHDLVHEDDRPADLEQFHRLMSGEFDSYAVEQRFYHKDGNLLWAAVSASRVDDERGRTLYGIRVLRDVTARKKAEETRTLLMHELNHRVKNTLSTVQSIVSQSLRKAGAPPQAREEIETRLFALSRAHDVLTREGWEGAWLADIVSEAIAPYRREGTERFRVHGPDVRLNTSQALAMSMALQELATNAVKYGSLSADHGLVDIAWSVGPASHRRRLHLAWKESGGPPVQPPASRGFGTRLIERGLAAELEGDVRLDFAPDGVACTADLPLG